MLSLEEKIADERGAVALKTEKVLMEEGTKEAVEVLMRSKVLVMVIGAVMLMEVSLEEMKAGLEVMRGVDE